MTIICDAKDPDLLREAGRLCFHQPSFNVSGLFSELHTKLSAGQTEAGDGIKRHQWVLDRAWTAAARLGRARSQARTPPSHGFSGMQSTMPSSQLEKCLNFRWGRGILAKSSPVFQKDQILVVDLCRHQLEQTNLHAKPRLYSWPQNPGTE